MAAGQHNPSRRALLGAAVGLSFETPVRQAHRLLRMSGEEEVGPPPGCTRSPSPSKLGQDWKKALAAFEEAQAAVRGIEGATAGCGFEEEEALLPAHDSACEAAEGALGRLLLAPVPDLAGLAVKLELFFDHELEPNCVEPEVVAAIRWDVQRLVLRQAQDERRGTA